MAYKLTIGYSTYNRKPLIVSRLKYLLTQKIPDNIEIFIIDNGSADGTFEAISHLAIGSKIKIYKNTKNIGFANIFIEVLKRAKGDYVIWTSDKDEINLNNIQALLYWIRDKKPDIVVLNYIRRLELKKYHRSIIRKNKTRLIKWDDLWGCSHLPGIIWKRTKVLAGVYEWNKLKKDYPETSKYYPNFLLLIRIIPSLNSYFFNSYISYQKDYADKSYHAALAGDHYSHLKSRWLQHKELISFIELCASKSKNIKVKIYLQKMYRYLNQNLYDYISLAIREEKPEIYSYFSYSYLSFYNIKRMFRLLQRIVISFLNEPLITIVILKKRLKAKFNI